MSRFKQLFTNWRVLLVIAVVLFTIIAMRPNPWASGVAISSVAADSSAFRAGIESPKRAAPMLREIIKDIDGAPVSTLDDYHDLITRAAINQTLTIRTNKNTYRLTIPEDKKLGLRVSKAPRSNIRLGLELQGGTRVLLQPEAGADEQMVRDAIDSMSNRLNVYGLADILITEVTAPALPGEEPTRYIRVEVPGASEEEVKELVAQQGKFEASIANQTVFVGGAGDVTYVCRTAQCSGIDPSRGCGRSETSDWVCGFFFQITLSPAAAQRQADITKNLSVISDAGDRYLNSPLVLRLDDREVDKLNIAADLKGRPVTDIQITGSGVGRSEQEALTVALENMKKLQTVLITGSLPTKLEVVRTDAISPVLGSAFLRNTWLMAGVAAIAVLLVLFIAYRRPIIVIPIVLIAASEILMLLGFYALLGWSLDLAAIAGIIAAIGTSVNDQIVMADETLRGRREVESYGFKERLKRAFGIIFSAYAIIIVAMVPLLFAGAGLLKGFAIATIVGLSAGVLVTRPAYAKIIQILLGQQ